MGIYDRDYYRREGPSILGSLGGPGQACKWIIIVNVVVFVMQIVTTTSEYNGQAGRSSITGGSLTDALILDTDAVMHGELWRLVTYAFLHAGLWHIVFNMLFLWWFGTDVEAIYGAAEFAVFYFVAALLGGICFVVGNYYLNIPGRYCLGASGAVTAVMVLCAMYYPHKTILLFFFLPIPIWLFIGFQVVTDAYSFLIALQHHSPPAGNTAVTVHLAGAGFAYLYARRHWRLMNFGPDFRAWKRRLSQPRLRVYRESPSASTPAVGVTTQGSDIDEHMEASLDRVLEKVAKSGRDSLTEREREILLRASEVYKRRRT
jgi:membrane associated rhomboid family serine protease